jgi:hypothetical protein
VRGHGPQTQADVLWSKAQNWGGTHVGGQVPGGQAMMHAQPIGENVHVAGLVHVPPHDPMPPVALHGGGSVTVVVVAVDVVVVVVAQPLAPQASQQLANDPTHAAPPAGERQTPSLRLIAQVVFPDLRVRQHVTNPGLPHVERAAQRITTPAQSGFASVAFACAAAHRR